MAQNTEDAEKEKQVRIQLHRIILNAKKAKVNKKTIEVHQIENLYDITPFSLWKDDGVHEIEATAKFFFVPKDGNGYLSLKSSHNFKVKIKKHRDFFELLETPIINDKINTSIISILKQTEDE